MYYTVIKKNFTKENNAAIVGKTSYQIEGLMFAMIMVFELPPRESCDKIKHTWPQREWQDDKKKGVNN